MAIFYTFSTLYARTISDKMYSMILSPYEQKLHANALRMRARPTPAEAIFGNRLKASGIDFRAQFVIGRYIVDFVLPGKMIVFELDGRGHNHPSKHQYDKKRTEFLQALGFKVKRVRNQRAATYPLNRIRHKQSAKQTAFSQALKDARSLLTDFIKSRDHRIEVRSIDKEHQKMVAANRERKPVVIKRG